MKTTKLLAMMATALLIAACAETDELQQTVQQENANTADNVVNFSTYMGRTSTTRGGAYGSINTAKLAEADYGFGVFAYQTGTRDYDAYRTQNGTKERYPNFMYNEHIVGDGAGGWRYADVLNTKYWPNELSGVGAVDDQNNDSGNDPATTTNANGGKVSFFAYAPYVDYPYDADTKVGGITGQAVSTTDHEGTTAGIIAFSGNAFNGGTGSASNPDNARRKFSDPYIQYRISNDNSHQVDLLWGTAGNNGVNVLGAEQLGVDASSYKDVDKDNTPEATRPVFNVNADLTKQKTNGTVELVFKHALAKIGGSYVGTGDGSDEDGNTPTNGLMVILDIDKDGKETGGALQPYAGKPLETGSVASDNLYNTKVTINEVVLENEKQLTDPDGIDAINNNTTFDYEDATYTTTLYNTGIFNLVTGVWHDYKTVGDTKRTHTIEPTSVPTGAANNDADNGKDAVLNHHIAEPRTASPANWTNDYTKAAFEKLPIGVTTVAKNVYENDAQPFVFIPGTYPIITITIDYTVRTYDAKLAKKYSEVRQKVTKRLYILDEIKLNKQYNILMHLGLTSVKFTASVSDWEVTNTSGTVTNPDDGTSPVATYDQDVDHVYLPINVAGIATVAMGGTTYDVPADNTVILPAVAKGGATLDLGVLTFTRSDGTTLSTDDLKDATLTTTITNINGGTTFVTETHAGGSFQLTVPANTGVARTDKLTVEVTSPAGVKLATLNIEIPQEGDMTTTAAAAKKANETAKRAFTATDEKTIDYTIESSLAGMVDFLKGDFAKIVAALYTDGGVTKIAFNGDDYTWGGTEWTAGTKKLTDGVNPELEGIEYGGRLNVTLNTDRGNITVKIYVKSAADLAKEYVYSPTYTYTGTVTCNVNSVTYTINSTDVGDGTSIMNDMARFLGALYRNGGVTALTYNSKNYTWDDALTLAGSRWTNGTTTLVHDLAYDFRDGVPSGTALKFGSNVGDITFKVVIQ